MIVVPGCANKGSGPRSLSRASRAVGCHWARVELKRQGEALGCRGGSVEVSRQNGVRFIPANYSERLRQ